MSKTTVPRKIAGAVLLAAALTALLLWLAAPRGGGRTALDAVVGGEASAGPRDTVR